MWGFGDLKMLCSLQNFSAHVSLDFIIQIQPQKQRKNLAWAWGEAIITIMRRVQPNFFHIIWMRSQDSAKQTWSLPNVLCDLPWYIWVQASWEWWGQWMKFTTKGSNSFIIYICHHITICVVSSFLEEFAISIHCKKPHFLFVQSSIDFGPNWFFSSLIM